MRPEEVVRVPEAGVVSGCGLPDMGAGSWSTPLEEQYVMLTTEQSLQPLVISPVFVK